jgi:hypothetical protein
MERSLIACSVLHTLPKWHPQINTLKFIQKRISTRLTIMLYPGRPWCSSVVKEDHKHNKGTRPIRSPIGHAELGRWFAVGMDRETFRVRYSTLFAAESVSEGGGVCGLAVGVGGGSSDPTSPVSGGSAAEAVGVGGKLGTCTLETGVPVAPGEVCPCSLEIGVPDKPGEVMAERVEIPTLALHRVNHRVHNKGDGVIHLRVVKLVCEVLLPPFPSQPLWQPVPQCASELPQ